CEKIMYTKHRSGSLRGEPTLAGWTERDPTTGQENPQGYLFLGVADELDSMHLEAYPVPIENPRTPPLPMNPEPRFAGRTWLPAHEAAEKSILVTDAGTLGLLAHKQKRNEDNPLFSVGPPDPKHKGPDIDLARFLKLKEQEKGVRGRSQIVYAAEPD